MSVLFTDIMTVYNYRLNSVTGEEKWLKTVVRGVQWRHNKDEFSINGKVENASKVESITIDFMREYGNKQYVLPNEFKKLADDEKSGCWTLDAGNDILVLGETDLDVTNSRDIKTLKESYQYVAVVTSVSDNRSRPRLKHIKVVAK